MSCTWLLWNYSIVISQGSFLLSHCSIFKLPEVKSKRDLTSETNFSSKSFFLFVPWRTFTGIYFLQKAFSCSWDPWPLEADVNSSIFVRCPFFGVLDYLSTIRRLCQEVFEVFFRIFSFISLSLTSFELFLFALQDSLIILPQLRGFVKHFFGFFSLPS